MISSIAIYRVLSLPGRLWRDDCGGDSQSRRRLPRTITGVEIRDSANPGEKNVSANRQSDGSGRRYGLLKTLFPPKDDTGGPRNNHKSMLQFGRSLATGFAEKPQT